MSTRVQTLIHAAQELSPLEQLDLVTAISQSLHHNYQQSQPTLDFWHPQTLEQLVDVQQTQPIADLADLEASFWPAEESVNDLVEYIYQQRQEDQLRQ